MAVSGSNLINFSAIALSHDLWIYNELRYLVDIWQQKVSITLSTYFTFCHHLVDFLFIELILKVHLSQVKQMYTGTYHTSSPYLSIDSWILVLESPLIKHGITEHITGTRTLDLLPGA